MNKTRFLEILSIFTIFAFIGVIIYLYQIGRNIELRNAEREDEIVAITNILDMNTSLEINFEKYIISNPENTISEPISVGGRFYDENYFAGEINFEELGLEEEKVTDPLGGKYKIGALKIENKWLYEVVYITETESRKKVQKRGNYPSRHNIFVVAEGNGTQDILVKREHLGKLRVGDIITDDSKEFEVLEIGSDAAKVKVSANISGEVELHLIANETAGLVKTTENLAGNKDNDLIIGMEDDDLPY